MRRLLLVPALALVLVGTPVLALQVPTEPGAAVQDVPIAPDQSVDAGWQSPETPVDSALVGVTWQGDAEASFTVEARSSDGSWSAVPGLDESDVAPDAGSQDAAGFEAATTGEHATEPVWIGDDVTAVRVKVDEGSAADVGVAAVVENGGTTPDGAAGALAGVVGPLDGTDRWLYGGALMALVALLVALALGWRPTRHLRGRKWLTMLGLSALLLAACVPVAQAPPPQSPSNKSSGGGGGTLSKPSIVSRAQWGAQGFACGNPEYASSVKFAVVHHTVNSNNYNSADAPRIIRGIQAYHMSTLGYCDIAYNFLIDNAGKIYEGRAGGTTSAVIGAHTGGFNTQSFGVAMVGDFTSAQPTGAQYNSLVNLLRWRLSVAGVDPSKPFSTRAQSSPCGCVRWADGTIVAFPVAILAHRDLDFTSCPGDAFFPRMDQLRSAVKAGISSPTTTTTKPVVTTTTKPPVTTTT